MKSHAAVPGLARLFFRAHNELHAILGALPSSAGLSSPPRFNLQLDTLNFQLSTGQDGAPAVTIVCNDGLLEYELTCRAEPGTPVVLEAKLKNLRTGEVLAPNGEALLSGEIPEGYRALHSEVMEQLKLWLPEKLLEQLLATAAKLKAEPKPQAAASAPPAQAGAPEAAAADTPAEADQWTQYVISRKGEADLRFTGVFVDGVRGPVVRGRFNELLVYRTKGGRYVGLRIGRSLWMAESDRAEVKAVDRIEDLTDFFGHGPLGKLLAQRLGIQTFVDIE